MLKWTSIQSAGNTPNRLITQPVKEVVMTDIDSSISPAIPASKACSTCKTVKDLSEFTRSKACSHGVSGSCRACSAEYKKAWRARNIERLQAKDRAYAAKNRVHLAEYNKAWRAKNADKISDYNKQRWAEEKQAKDAARHTYEMENREAIAAEKLAQDKLRKVKKSACDKAHREKNRYALGFRKVWEGMIRRCTNPTHDTYPSYGGRGIKVCDRWLNSFEDFRNDMGPRPEGYQIDRTNNDGNYEPSNCRWVTASQNSQNRRVMKHSPFGINGVSFTKGAYRATIMRKGESREARFDNLLDACCWRKSMENTFCP